VQLVHVYLNFPGTTDEALKLYASVFGTKVVMRQTFGETTFMSGVPEQAKGKVMHAQLPITEAVHLMASDAVPGFGPPVTYGNSFHVSVVAKDKAEADRAFAEGAEAALGERVPMVRLDLTINDPACADEAVARLLNLMHQGSHTG